MGKRRIVNKTEPIKEIFLCPVCGETNLEDIGSICPICGWEHDDIQSYEFDDEGGANKLSVTLTREWLMLKRKLNPRYTWRENAEQDGNPTREDLNKLRKLVKEKRLI